ncbi:VacJ family lipoprotein [Halomonas sp. Bachu 37]|uniref:MlaA family lipoprotein n=1 Tax=Halomonas kashgarensis TaxID=3084920 RepID=UPI00321724FC
MTLSIRNTLPVALVAAMLSGCAGAQVEERHPDDPWEGFNRRVFAFNDVLDRYALRPVAKGYRTIAPQPVQTGVGNFFSNLGEIRTALNSVLQGEMGNAATATSRFLINSTVGVGGLLDYATHMEITGREEDFGQTLGVWGWDESRYLVLPLLGPSTLRDATGLPADRATYPVAYVDEEAVRMGLTALRIVDARAGLLDQEELIHGDRYSFIRDTYLQRRRFEIRDGVMDDDPFAMDDFDFSDANYGEDLGDVPGSDGEIDNEEQANQHRDDRDAGDTDFQ